MNSDRKTNNDQEAELAAAEQRPAKKRRMEVDGVSADAESHDSNDDPTVRRTSRRIRNTKTQEEKWQAMYTRLQEYHKTYGNTIVSRKYDDKELYFWVDRQRHRCKRKDRIDLLKSIGFVWNLRAFKAEQKKAKAEAEAKQKKAKAAKAKAAKAAMAAKILRWNAKAEAEVQKVRKKFAEKEAELQKKADAKAAKEQKKAEAKRTSKRTGHDSDYYPNLPITNTSKWRQDPADVPRRTIEEVQDAPVSCNRIKILAPNLLKAEQQEQLY